MSDKVGCIFAVSFLILGLWCWCVGPIIAVIFGWEQSTIHIGMAVSWGLLVAVNIGLFFAPNQPPANWNNEVSGYLFMALVIHLCIFVLSIIE